MEPFNIPEVRNLLKKAPELDRQFIQAEDDIFESAKKELIAQFLESPVTQELLGGPDAENISGTLSGIGNLFSFIGFSVGTNPIQPILEILQNALILKNPTKQDTSNGYAYDFPVNIPIEEIIAATPMPWESGNSWIQGIESGISGFSNFIYRVSKSSRSGKGIETKKAINTGTFEPQPYLLSWLNAFSDKLSTRSNLTSA